MLSCLSLKTQHFTIVQQLGTLHLCHDYLYQAPMLHTTVSYISAQSGMHIWFFVLFLASMLADLLNYCISEHFDFVPGCCPVKSP